MLWSRDRNGYSRNYRFLENLPMKTAALSDPLEKIHLKKATSVNVFMNVVKFNLTYSLIIILFHSLAASFLAFLESIDNFWF